MTPSSVDLYRALNGTPAENLRKLLELLGGIQNIVGADDVVVIKPNVQWWNQGAPNLCALHALVEEIMARPGGFAGEVVIAENNHRGAAPAQSSGWAKRFDRNADLGELSTMGEVCGALKARYGRRFSCVHWIDVAAGARRVHGPQDGPGYVYCDGTNGVPLLAVDNGQSGERFRATIMTYPIFRTDQGTVVDFRNGVWCEGSYTGQGLRFLNLSALNHHSIYCGVTGSVKNYLGISDLSGGPDPRTNGRLVGEYYNFHSFPFDKWGPGPTPGMIGRAVGAFMRTIRRADLNICTAEWVGLASRTEMPAARTRAVAACGDAVALDYHCAKHVLYPNSGIGVHNPDARRRPLHAYLRECAGLCGGVLDEGRVNIVSYDLESRRFQDRNDLTVRGPIRWGTDPKTLLKYLYLALS
ncbi:MAG: hypothetical protein JW820_11930 [Spirochaetales bacterium]|nr:hypothetical protein [Spirochaetales bacterium]